MSQSKDLKKGIEMSDEELMEMVGGAYYMPCQKKYKPNIQKPPIAAPEYGVPIMKYGIIIAKYGVQPLYGVIPVDTAE